VSDGIDERDETAAPTGLEPEPEPEDEFVSEESHSLAASPPEPPPIALEDTQVAPPETLPDAEPVPIPVQPEPGEEAFEGWPAAQSSAVIEEMPAEVSVEHVRGEIDVPDGFVVLEGTPLGKRRSVGIVVSRFNGGVTTQLLESALEALEAAGVAKDAVTILPVPGAFELPLAAMALAKTRRYACIVALGAIVRGETPHFDYVASECASGLQLAAIETGIPVSFGVLTVDTVAQAEARIHKAAEAVRSALEMADLFARLRASARQ
jgi:6,7-dimethyl-8-ribityllumazine synthase